MQCSKAGVSCTTTIPRKKRFFGPIENITLHYKCLLALVSGLFPDKDVYNIEELMNLGKAFKFEMPSENSNEEEIQNIQDLKQHALEEENEENEATNETSESKRESSEETEVPANNADQKQTDIKDEEEESVLVTTKSGLPKLPPNIKVKSAAYDRDRLIMDRFGHTHFIGNFGTASLLNGLCDIIIKRSFSVKPPTSTQDIRDSSVQTITSENEPVYQYPTHLYNLDAININRFPLINLLNRIEADMYKSVFFEKVHPYYFIFNEFKFDEKYNLFWEEIKKTNNKDDEPTPMKIGSAEICCIYMVWILGRRFQLYTNPQDLPINSELDDDLIGRYIDIIKLSLSDIVLTPTLDGIRLLILLSVYLSSIKVRESGYCLMQMAAIQSKSLGLHRKFIVDKFNDEKADEMKRVMWSLTKSETTLCCSFGRASAIPWEEVDVELPTMAEVDNDLFKIYYVQSSRLTKIIFQILDNKRKSTREPLSLVSIEKLLLFQKNLDKFWESLPESWKDYKSLPVRRYKPKLHIQFHYYFINLTLPVFMHIVSTQTSVIRRDDPIQSLLVNGIKSSIKTAEILTYTDSNGFFNGTLYYDVFYSYNAIMVLTLTYILFKSSKGQKSKSALDLEYLDKEHDINFPNLMKAINLIRNLILNNLHQIDGTMRRMSDIIETLLEDLGIIQVLVKEFGARSSNVRKIEDRNESGSTSVNGGIIPGYYRKFKVNEKSKPKRRRLVKPTEGNTKNLESGTYPAAMERNSNMSYSSIFDFPNSRSNSSTNLGDQSGNFELPVYSDSPLEGPTESSRSATPNVNEALNSILDTELMEVLFGAEMVDANTRAFDGNI
ncbi:hypothetical protein OGAPHI_004283 [Ogataea philodendri]|uniref:Xylanolytic transcriptional activator regulatory domain-containing protein n=1 Tax=Ogataea philodendri TaxID=1378263 RepID=A0A9P8T599_9ASCO|nr:uncharacterized protein OGAPHI_004283 [Ogataea philodendri]KAH3666094.1 hypothetical protein OGAPHI_004283 [Ogataea philodendri]